MTAIEDRVVQLGERVLHYRECGTPDGVPVLALHGLPGTAEIWDAVATGLCASGRYRFMALTQCGFGASSRAATYSFEAFRDDVFAFADALGLGPFVLVGHSMGGTVAALAAEQEPERLSALVLVDTVPPRDGFDRPAPPRPDGPLPFDWEVMPAIIRQLGRPDPAWWARLPQISVPALVVGGGPTSHVSQDQLAEAVKLMPQARLVTLDGAGHAAHLTQPERFLAEVNAFLDAVL